MPRPAQPRRSPSCPRFLALAGLLLGLSACAPAACSSNFRLLQNFDDGAPGSSPAPAPPPSPPFDHVVWTQQFLQPTIVARDGGGRWLRVRPTGNYFVRNQAQALSAFSDVLARPGAGLRGHLALRLDGVGHVVLAIHAGQGQSGTQGGPLGGVSLRASGLGGADVATLTDSDLSVPREPFGTGLAPYTPGQVVEIRWTIDQAGRMLNLNVSPGDSRQLSFAPSQGGVARTPLQRLFITIDTWGMSRTSTLFVDDFTVEEL